jgi:hypothetical protein
MLDLSQEIELIGLDKPYSVDPKDIKDEGETLWLRTSPLWMVALPRFNKDGSHFEIDTYCLRNKVS